MSKRVQAGSPRVAVAYLRASKDEQRLSPEAQRATVEAWAAREGVQVAAWCVDQGVCSVTPIDERPALLAALAALREHGAGVLVVAKRDRIARDVVLAAGVEREAARLGARVTSASGEGNGDSPADQFMRTVVDGAAQYERGLIRARTKAALAAKSAKGERVGAVPFGFTLAPDGVHLVAVPSEQETIARARQLDAEGRTLRAVATQLAVEKHVSRTGRVLAASQVRRMLVSVDPRATAA
jgi:DNA invertase Pin-like site-specific DNA recombinase